MSKAKCTEKSDKMIGVRREAGIIISATCLISLCHSQTQAFISYIFKNKAEIFLNPKYSVLLSQCKIKRSIQSFPYVAVDVYVKILLI